MIKVFANSAAHYSAGNALARRLEGRVQKTIAIGVGAESAKKVLAEKENGALAINILDPQIRHNEFDLIFLPAHEPYAPAKNIVPIFGLINHVTPSKNKREGVAVLVGGKHIGGNFTEDDAENLAAIINNICRAPLPQGGDGGGLSQPPPNLPLRGRDFLAADTKVFITTSRRTEIAATKKLRELAKYDAFYNYNSDGHILNPYEEMLARAEAVIVTADSLRMISESCSSGAAVHIYTPQQTHFSYIALRDLLVKEGYANAEFSFAKTKLLDEAGRCAEIIINRFCVESGL